MAESSQTRRSPGRPPRAEQARRNRIVTLVTDGELRKLRALADQEAKTMSTFVHDALLKLLQDENS